MRIRHHAAGPPDTYVLRVKNPNDTGQGDQGERAWNISLHRVARTSVHSVGDGEKGVLGVVAGFRIPDKITKISPHSLLVITLL